MKNESLYFLTNRMNALAVLSSGLIRSKEAFKKYYDDFLQFVPGRLFLWRNGLPKSSVKALSEMSLFGFPVAFEISTVGIEAKAFVALEENLRLIEGKKKLSDKTVAIFPDGVIPLKSVSAIHFQSEEDMNNFTSHKMDNLDTEYCELIVSPELFSSMELDWDSVRDAVSAMPAGRLSDSSLYSKIDSYSGAVAMIATVMPENNQWIALIKSLLEMKTDGSSAGCESACDCIDGLYSLILNGTPKAKCTKKWEGEVFTAAMLKLAGMDMPRGFNATGFVEEVFEEFLLKKRTKAVKGKAEKGRDYLLSVLRNEVELKNLKDDGSLCLRALTLFLLRRDPEKVLESRHSNINPGVNVLTLAAALSGLFCGYARLSTELKDLSGDQSLYSVLMAAWCNEISGTDFISVPKKDVTVKITSKREGPVSQRVSLKVGRTGFRSYSLGPNDVMMVIYQQLKLANCNLVYDPDREYFNFVFEISGGRKQKVYIKNGAENMHGKHTVRFVSPCRSLEKEPLDLDAAVDLLERNDRPDTLCRFAISSDLKAVTVEVDQIVETADQAELLSHLHQVARTADEYEREAGRDDY